MRMDRLGSPSFDQVGVYARLFVNRADVVLTDSVGHWSWRKRRLSASEISSALAGSGSLGLASVSAAGASKWICLDLDDDTHAGKLFRIVEALTESESAVLEASRRGFHLWVLIEPAPWMAARRWGLQLARDAGLAAIEIFPKSGGLNGVRAPLTKHPKDGRIHPLIDPETGEVLADPWPLLTSRQPVRAPEIVVPADRPHPSGRTGRTGHAELVAEVERHTTLRFYGDEQAIGRCPFHDDQHPSFGVIGGYWKCFAGCGSGGLAAFRRLVLDHGLRNGDNA
jgi:hypothetical protein